MKPLVPFCLVALAFLGALIGIAIALAVCWIRGFARTWRARRNEDQLLADRQMRRGFEVLAVAGVLRARQGQPRVPEDIQ